MMDVFATYERLRPTPRTGSSLQATGSKAEHSKRQDWAMKAFVFEAFLTFATIRLLR